MLLSFPLQHYKILSEPVSLLQYMYQDTDF